MILRILPPLRRIFDALTHPVRITASLGVGGAVCLRARNAKSEDFWYRNCWLDHFFFEFM